MKTRQIDSQNGLTMMHKMKKLKIFPLKFINVAKVFTCNTQFKYWGCHNIKASFITIRLKQQSSNNIEK